MAEKEYTCEDCCEFINLNTYCPVEGEFIDDRHKNPCAIFRPKSPPTIFNIITASPEVLAKELVTTSFEVFKDCTVYWAWLGNGRREAYYSKSEAIAATVARLKELADEHSNLS